MNSIKHTLSILYKSALLMGLIVFTSYQSPKDPVVVGYGKAHVIPKHFLGANANLTLFDQPWNNNSLLKATIKTGVSTLRYPGGTIGNYWDWDTGWIDRSIPDSIMIKWVVSNGLTKADKSYDLENLATLTATKNIVPIFMVNMLSKNLEHTIRNLQKARALKIPIKYIELGNELYFDLPFPKLKFPTPEVYGKTCHQWIAALKPLFPEAKFAIIGNYLKRHPRQIDWNRRVLKHCKNADAITFHKYGPSALDGRREKRRYSAGTEGKGDKNTATRVSPNRTKDKQLWQLKTLQDPKAFCNMLTAAQNNATSFDQMYIPEEMEVWVTEFNIRDDDSVVLHSWSHSLLLSIYLTHFLNSGVTITNMHNLIGNLFGMIHTDENGLNHLLYDEIDTTPYAPSAGGIIVSLFADVLKGKNKFQELQIDHAPVQHDDRNNPFKTLQAFRFKNDETENILILNYGFDPQKLDISLLDEHYEQRTYYAKTHTPINGWQHISVVNSKDVSKNLSLKPLSITLLKP